MWEQDGWDARWRIGVLVPHADVGPESELRAMAPREVGIHATRVPTAIVAPSTGASSRTMPLAGASTSMIDLAVSISNRP